MILVLKGMEAEGYLRYMAADRPREIVIRPQTSGPCVHFSGNPIYPDGDGPDAEPREGGDACQYPGEGCPHLFNGAVTCPILDCMRARPKAEPLIEYRPCPPEFAPPAPDETAPYVVPRSPRKDAWTSEEDEVVRGAEHPAAAVEAYRAAFPDSARTDEAIRKRYKIVLTGMTGVAPVLLAWTPEEDAVLRDAPKFPVALERFRAAFPDSTRTPAAISQRYYRVRSKAKKSKPAKKESTPLPDFAGDTAPVTQCEPLPEGKGLYGDAKALHADMMDSMMCDRPLSANKPIVKGDRVALVADPKRVGKVTFISKSGTSASVEFPGPGPARVYDLADLRRARA